jgi:thioredoxin-like negative regulator of GroEL
MGDDDLRAILKDGDARAKRGDVPGAVGCYERVAERYQAEGFALRAIALYRQILTLDPAQVEAAIRLAETCAALGLTGEAVKELEALASRVEGPTLVRVLTSLVALQPDHPARVRLHELTSRSPFR